MFTSAVLHGATRNRLLAALPAEEYARLSRLLHPVSLCAGEVLSQPGSTLPYVHFPTTAVIAAVVVMRDGATAGAGVVGSEGMVCPCTFLECDATLFRLVVQNAGEALRMRADDFRAAVGRSEPLQRLLRRSADAFLVQVSQVAACNALHPLEQRCCRWLLMTLDRAGPGDFLLTQEALARMLGASRPAVSDAARGLQGRGLIRYARGKVTVLDREGLEAAACECHGRVRAKLDALTDRPAPAPRRGEMEFRHLVEQLPAATYTCDSGGLITSFNRRAAEFWGREPRLNDPLDRY